ncbi:MAG: Bifunctional homocysteine S-methyltransferase/5,10-methylenetetrahydrofolate reductase [Chloroflexi bacterium ADurb.Bin180]|nr:MAG: Bifunctional homocysteine S-methyltransferase/5,10-methylenetetrahydrofolate reductase [Chloroflexi bacterium ADurb.Bin180]HNR96275.1 methylenetetrahydrofolate reductase [Anaerolineae bacterium]HNT04985.1 methylenetetrahydrofolate reductase [Anaerolineae bacterium]HQJ50772.1 methylenetetrahydrofolate reductase [Anaerolineae bacterium]
MKVSSNLEKILASGQFAATGELGPPKSAEAEAIKRKAALLKGLVDAVNITDNQTAIVRMSSIAVGIMLLQEGIEPTIQMTCRDRNRLAIQADLLGASALGIKNLLCLTGDHQKFGNHPTARGVYDLDSIQLVALVKALRDEKKFANGEAIETVEPRFFIGAAENPFADPFDYRPYRLAKKVAAGADFIQTQLIYNVPKFKEFMKRVVDLGIHEKCFILAGVGPIKSIGMARYMQNSVPGMDVPEDVIARLKGVPKEQVRKEGIKQCADIIQEMREIPGVRGVHVMAIEWEEAVQEILELAGLLPRPRL